MTKEARNKLIALMLKERGLSTSQRVTALSRVRRLRASLAQERMWFWDRATWPRSFLHNVPLAARLRGELNADTLEAAFHMVVSRQEGLRSSFDFMGDKVYQTIHNDLIAPFTQLDFSEDADALHRCEVFGLEEARLGFELSNPPLVRATLIRIAAEDHVLLVTAHHILWDGWSTGLLVYELATNYQRLHSGEEWEPAPLPVQYADWAAWQHQRLTGATLQMLEDYWRAELSGARTVHIAPTLKTPVSEPRDLGMTQSFSVSADLTAALRRLGQEEDATLFMVVLAALTAMIHARSGENDLTVGGLISNRTTTDIDEIIGYFVNTVVIRSRTRADQSFRDHLRHIRATTLRAYEHQELPVGRTARAVANYRPDGWNKPLYSVDFVFQSAERPETSFGDVKISVPDRNTRTADYDMGLVLWQRLADLSKTDGMEGWWEYKTDLFDDTAARALINEFLATLQAATEAPDVPISRMLSATDSLLTWSPLDRTPLDELVDTLDIELLRSRDDVVLIARSGESFTGIDLANAVNGVARDEACGIVRAWSAIIRAPQAVDAAQMATEEAHGSYSLYALQESTLRLRQALNFRSDDVVLMVGAGPGPCYPALAIAALSASAKVHERERLSPSELSTLFDEHSFSIVCSSASSISDFIAIAPACLRMVVVFDDRIEQCALKSLTMVNPGLALVRVGAFGPDATPFTIHEIDRDAHVDPEWETIGRPLPGVQLYVLDSTGQPVRSAATGNLFIGDLNPDYVSMAGAAVDNLSKPDPFSDVPDRKMIMSGERVRRNHQGLLERQDRPPTVIRCGERSASTQDIDAALRAHEEIRDCATVKVRGPDGSWCFVSYVVASDAFTASDPDGRMRGDATLLSRPADFCEEILSDPALVTDEPILVVGHGEHSALLMELRSRGCKVHHIPFHMVETISPACYGPFNVVVLHDVVRGLTGTTALERLIDRICECTAQGGKILLTDIPDHRLLKAQLSVARLAEADETALFSDVRKDVERDHRRYHALALHPDWFLSFSDARTSIAGVTARPQDHSSDRATSAFMFAAELSVAGADATGAGSATSPTELEWNPDRSATQIHEWDWSTNLVIRSVPDLRVQTAKGIERGFDEVLPGAKVRDARRVGTQSGQHNAVREILKTARSKSRFAMVCCTAHPEKYDIVLSSERTLRSVHVGTRRAAAPTGELATNLHAAWTRLTLCARLRSKLVSSGSLQPSLIVAVHSIQRLDDGELNVWGLPSPRCNRRRSKYVPLDADEDFVTTLWGDLIEALDVTPGDPLRAELARDPMLAAALRDALAEARCTDIGLEQLNSMDTVSDLVRWLKQSKGSAYVD